MSPSLGEIAPLAEPARRRVPPGTRAWFAFFIFWLAGLAAVALWLLSRSEHGDDPLAMRAWILVLMCFYLSLCSTFLPLPTAGIILLAAAPDYALLAQPLLNILLVAVLGALATTLSNLTEYHLLAYGFGGGWGQRLRATETYAWAVRWFDRAPWQALALVAFIPIPIDVVRWLAALRGYSRLRFGLAYLLGRSGRYAIFAGCSVLFALGARQILLIQVGLVLAALTARGVWWLVHRGGPRPAA
jgi:membrane protein YqaA with SNARE-associated domain